MKNLKKLREARGLSQEKLANKFFLTQQSIYKYETKDNEPTLETLKKMADFFETSVDYLIGYTDINHKIEDLKQHHLAEQEIELIRMLRKLGDKEQDTIFRLITVMLDEIKKDEV